LGGEKEAEKGEKDWGNILAINPTPGKRGTRGGKGREEEGHPAKDDVTPWEIETTTSLKFGKETRAKRTQKKTSKQGGLGKKRKRENAERKVWSSTRRKYLRFAIRKTLGKNRTKITIKGARIKRTGKKTGKTGARVSRTLGSLPRKG